MNLRKSTSTEGRPLDEIDIALLCSLTSTGMPLRAAELAGAVTPEEVKTRMHRLEAEGYIQIGYTVTTRGGSFAYRHVHCHRDLSAAV